MISVAAPQDGEVFVDVPFTGEDSFAGRYESFVSNSSEITYSHPLGSFFMDLPRHEYC